MPEQPLAILTALLGHGRGVDYQGYNKHDGLLSPVLDKLLGGSRVGRLVAIQTIMRAPVNLRPLFGVPKTRNPKGIGLFAHANLNAFALTGDRHYQIEGERLLGWLLNHANNSHDGISWGYQYPWQDVGFFAPANLSNRVVTCWIGYAFFRAWKLLGKLEYLNTCQKICTFLRNAPNRILDTPEELCFSYVPDPTVTWAVMDVSALCGKMFALTGLAANDSGLLADSKRCITYVLNRQTDYHAWFYTDPPKDSHITHDNYHTGIILDCILDYAVALDNEELLLPYRQGLDYYQRHLFLDSGAPKWMNNKVFPLDIHGAAQGIISFSKAALLDTGYLHQAEKTLTWTVNALYDRRHTTFWYQRTPFFTKKFTLLRWCNAWMARALAQYLLAKQHNDGIH